MWWVRVRFVYKWCSLSIICEFYVVEMFADFTVYCGWRTEDNLGTSQMSLPAD